MPKKTGLRYPEEFKAEAVQLARSSPDRSIRQLAYELGIADQTLRNWIKQAEIDRAEAQHEASQDFRLQHPGCYTGQDRCAHRLNPPRPSSQRKTGLGESLRAHRGGEG
jgi:transposase-like protein